MLWLVQLYLSVLTVLLPRSCSKASTEGKSSPAFLLAAETRSLQFDLFVLSLRLHSQILLLHHLISSAPSFVRTFSGLPREQACLVVSLC